MARSAAQGRMKKKKKILAEQQALNGEVPGESSVAPVVKKSKKRKKPRKTKSELGISQSVQQGELSHVPEMAASTECTEKSLPKSYRNKKRKRKKIAKTIDSEVTKPDEPSTDLISGEGNEESVECKANDSSQSEPHESESRKRVKLSEPDDSGVSRLDEASDES